MFIESVDESFVANIRPGQFVNRVYVSSQFMSDQCGSSLCLGSGQFLLVFSYYFFLGSGCLQVRMVSNWSVVEYRVQVGCV
ncbi:hypothetical protein Hanom_Chr08g00712041 [Helianthus anomalus]